ncbi:hypothetical protein K492DRAFT_150315, partial [Lichtheimia hyalospora FSU 10163]
MTLGNVSEVSEYELKRQRLIEENKKLLEELGLAGDNERIAPISGYKSDDPPPRKKARSHARKLSKPPPAPMRTSRRLKGEQPDDTVDIEAFLDQNDKMRQAAIALKVQSSEEQQSYDPHVISAPVTLVSIGTTIWSLGELYTGKGRSKYWSGRGCRYRHPYPIGFRASKQHFGNTYHMAIEKGEDGPVFKVQVNESKTIFEGATPTAPWTEACKKSKSQGTRVSGPLFYGFSDLVTMRMIERMEGYELAGEPEEQDEAK